MDILVIVALVAVAFAGAKAEINIEGKDGWASNLPTCKIHNSITRLLFGQQPLTGYHLWLLFFILGLVHFPLLLGIPWSLSHELKLLALLCFFWVVEDFLWFVLNPYFGLKKFNRIHVHWHRDWLWLFPKVYYKFLLAGLCLIVLSSIT